VGGIKEQKYKALWNKLATSGSRLKIIKKITWKKGVYFIGSWVNVIFVFVVFLFRVVVFSHEKDKNDT
jgi:hypothetical protein